MTHTGRHHSITDLVKEVSDSKEFAKEVDQFIAKRRLVKQLVSLRSAKNFSQEDISSHLKCTQSRISKLENGEDSDLRIGDLREYADALGFELHIGLAPKNWKITDQIKLHAMAIKKNLSKLVGLAHVDEKLAAGIANFFGEAFLNLLKIVKESADELPPCKENGHPYVKIEVHEETHEIEIRETNQPANPCAGQGERADEMAMC